jgi:hypothetical protein
MTTVIIDSKSRTGRRLLKDIGKHPRVAKVINSLDCTPCPIPEEDLISLTEFKTYMEKRAFERLGLKITL